MLLILLNPSYNPTLYHPELYLKSFFNAETYEGRVVNASQLSRLLYTLFEDLILSIKAWGKWHCEDTILDVYIYHPLKSKIYHGSFFSVNASS